MLGAMKNNAIFVVHLIFQICLAKLPWEGRDALGGANENANM